MSDTTDKPDELAREAARGRTARTPALAFGGVIGVVALAVAVFLAIVLAVYFLA
jgi:hypothetical protein